MVNKRSVRLKNRDLYHRSTELRKKGLSYSEIMREIPVAKSTLNNWLSLAGLTILPDHLRIQKLKRSINWTTVGMEASVKLRKERNNAVIEEFRSYSMKYLNDPLFVAGAIAYEAEGAKTEGVCNFSNSDYKMVLLFIKFFNKFLRTESTMLKYRLYIHESRKIDLDRIIEYWSTKLNINRNDIALTWKKNLIKNPRQNIDYVGQLSVNVNGGKLMSRKILASSAIIMGHWGIS